MPYCGPPCAVPSCESAPLVPLRSSRCGSYGYGNNRVFGSSRPVEASSLGRVNGITPSCISELPPLEMVCKPPPLIVVIPGATLTSSCEPVHVSGGSPCSLGEGSYDGRGLYDPCGIRGINCYPCA